MFLGKQIKINPFSIDLNSGKSLNKRRFLPERHKNLSKDLSFQLLFFLKRVKTTSFNDLFAFAIQQGFKDEKNVLKKINKLSKEGFINVFSDSRKKKVYSLSEKGLLWASYISPLFFLPSKEVVIFLSPQSVSKELEIPISSLKRGRKPFTYLSIYKKLYILKKISIDDFPLYPYLQGINDLLKIIEDPPLKLLKALQKFALYEKDGPPLISYIQVLEFLKSQGKIYSLFSFKIERREY